MVHQGDLLKKLIRRKKLNTTQASEMLGFSRDKLNRLFNKEALDEVTLEEIEKIFDVTHKYFVPGDSPNKSQMPPERSEELRSDSEPTCWRMLAEARQEIIELQRQIIAINNPGINAPKPNRQLA